MYFIYQIGDVPLYNYLQGRDKDGVSLSFEPSWRAPATQFTGAGGSHFTGPSTRSLPESSSFSVDGVFTTKNHSQADWLYQKLRGMGGRLNYPLIAFRYEESPTEGCLPELDWVVAECIIESADLEESYASQEVKSAGYLSVAVSIEGTLITPFRRLSAWFWENRPYVSHLADPYSDTAAYHSLDNRFWQPSNLKELPENRFYMRWQDPDTLLLPSFWGVKYNYGDTGGASSDFQDFGTVPYFSNLNLWNYPPLPVYAFRGLQPSGSIAIETRQVVGPFAYDNLVTVSDLDLVELDSDLTALGYGGLLESDIIYTGNVLPFPGFVYRNNAILSGIRPKWSYPSEYPGILASGAGFVTFTKLLTEGQVAFSIDFRTL